MWQKGLRLVSKRNSRVSWQIVRARTMPLFNAAKYHGSMPQNIIKTEKHRMLFETSAKIDRHAPKM